MITWQKTLVIGAFFILVGILYFFVDRGQPHLLRLRTVVPLDAGSKLSTTTTLNVQFATRTTDGAVVRTDDQPFPAADEKKE